MSAIKPRMTNIRRRPPSRLLPLSSSSGLHAHDSQTEDSESLLGQLSGRACCKDSLDLQQLKVTFGLDQLLLVRYWYEMLVRGVALIHRPLLRIRLCERSVHT